MGPRPGISLFLLRLALGITFLWAGLGKVLLEDSVRGEQAAMLAKMGVIKVGAPSGKEKPASKPAPKSDQRPAESPARPVPKEPGPGVPPALVAVDRVQDQDLRPSDFPDPVRVTRVNMLAVVIARSANPGLDDAGASRMILWPPAMATGRWPVYLAWTVALTELLGGLCLLVGLGTRVFAFLLAGTMIGAMWLTEIGPAIQNGNTFLGFLPRYPGLEAAPSPDGYMTILWQFLILCTLLTLLAQGAGRISLDVGFSRPAKPAAPKPKPPGAKPA